MFLIIYIFDLLIFGAFEYSVNSGLINPLHNETDFNQTFMLCHVNCKPLSEPTVLNYILHVKPNSTGESINELNEDLIKKTSFNSSNPIRIIAHGWRSAPNKEMHNLFLNAFQKKGNFNIIFVNWTACSKTPHYIEARCCVEDVGSQIATFINFLNEHCNVNFKDVTLIGHSLGAHVVGYAGKYIKNGKVSTIIGLDPVLPCFNYLEPQTRLSSKDAEYVETIHTNGDHLGFMEPIGHASFYPNWGKKQNGCEKDFFGVCSHYLAYKFYAESINENNFIATKCESFDDLLEKNCTEETNIKMGGEPANFKKGIFYLKTNAAAPYGMG